MKETLEIVTRTAVIHNQLMPSKLFFLFGSYESSDREKKEIELTTYALHHAT